MKKECNNSRTVVDLIPEHKVGEQPQQKPILSASHLQYTSYAQEALVLNWFHELKRQIVKNEESKHA